VPITIDVTIHDWEAGADEVKTITLSDEVIGALVEVINLPEE
jgi:hypothetical protein